MVVINLTYFLTNIFPNVIAYRNFIDVACGDLLFLEMQKRYFSWALRSVIQFQQFSNVTAILSILDLCHNNSYRRTVITSQYNLLLPECRYRTHFNCVYTDSTCRLKSGYRCFVCKPYQKVGCVITKWNNMYQTFVTATPLRNYISIFLIVD